MAALTCNKTDQEMRAVAENLAKAPELARQLKTMMDEASEYFNDLIAIMAAACGRRE